MAYGRVGLRQVTRLCAVFTVIIVTWTHLLGAGRSWLTVAMGGPCYDLRPGHALVERVELEVRGVLTALQAWTCDLTSLSQSPQQEAGDSRLVRQ